MVFIPIKNEDSRQNTHQSVLAKFVFTGNPLIKVRIQVVVLVWILAVYWILFLVLFWILVIILVWVVVAVDAGQPGKPRDHTPVVWLQGTLAHVGCRSSWHCLCDFHSFYSYFYVLPLLPELDYDTLFPISLCWNTVGFTWEPSLPPVLVYNRNTAELLPRLELRWTILLWPCARWQTARLVLCFCCWHQCWKWFHTPAHSWGVCAASWFYPARGL